ncbi:MAG: L,D-transpeptidase [candidate division Zixibacteria bacterium]|nr:L,D-transpeptidase [candidate division Zixibacteria bacterium]
MAGGAFIGAPELRNSLLYYMATPSPALPDTATAVSIPIEKLRKRTMALQTKYESMTPKSSYLIVDTSTNRFQIMDGLVLRHQGICSTGSYVLLKSPDKREWLFSTPRGMLTVLNKKKAPVWHKPDWAFIEEGLPVPPRNAPERFESGVLGEYALALGDGYLIHGTLYKRQLGMPVTHGCVRLGDEDLRVVYQSMAEGSKVFIY